jgi:hypothetical protein
MAHTTKQDEMAMHASAIHAATSEVAQVEHEIEQLEARLAQMALHDDCAYEKAMVRAYEGMLDERRRRLASLQTSI